MTTLTVHEMSSQDAVVDEVPTRGAVSSIRPPAGSSRLLLHRSGGDWSEHIRSWGHLPSISRAPSSFIEEVARAGLRGRGGAGFPTATKLREVAAGSRPRRPPVVVANGVESEPMSSKDLVLSHQAPHLVLDGMTIAAEAVGADLAVLCVKEGSPALPELQKALLARRGGAVSLQLATVPCQYVAGQETALVEWLSSGRVAPRFAPPRPSERGFDRRPTLVDNVETLAHLALIARFGAAWWRQVGTSEEPGTTLVTIGGAVELPGVLEVATGTPLADILHLAGVATSYAGLLVGGYFGTWLRPDQVPGLTWDRGSLQLAGSMPGCGALVALPVECCPLAEASRVLRWLAGQSAGQCGPCVNGLPAMADAFEAVVLGDPSGEAYVSIERWAGQIHRRGGCQMPDGAVGLTLSALRTFGLHVQWHRLHGPCQATARSPVLATPSTDVHTPVRLARRRSDAP